MGAIAWALTLAPKVMLFDEPTSTMYLEMVGKALDVMKTLALVCMTNQMLTRDESRQDLS